MLFLFLALKGVDWAEFADLLMHIDLIYIVVVFVWSTGSYLARSFRWRVILSTKTPVSGMNVFWANMSGYLGNLILPARAGEIVRAVYISLKENIQTAFALAAGISERLVDLAALVIVSAVTLQMVGSYPASILGALQFFSFVAVLGVIFLFMLPITFQSIERGIKRSSYSDHPIVLRIKSFLEAFVDGLSSLLHVERFIPFLLYTALIWVMDGAGMVFLSYSVGEELTMTQSLLLISALGISSAIPSTPGYVGVYQFVAILVLTPIGFSKESALAFILLVQVINLLVVSVWGGMGLWQFGRAKKGLIQN